MTTHWGGVSAAGLVVALSTAAAADAQAFARNHFGAHVRGFAGGNTPDPLAETVRTSARFDGVIREETRIDADPGVVFGGAAGLRYRSAWLDLEVSRRTGDVEAVSDAFNLTAETPVEGAADRASEAASVTAVMLNTRAEAPFRQRISPYVGVGVGAARFSVSLPSETGRVDLETWDYAWQVEGGVMVRVTPQTSLGLGYRYFEIPRLADLEDAGVDDVVYAAGSVIADVRYEF